MDRLEAKEKQMYLTQMSHEGTRTKSQQIGPDRLAIKIEAHRLSAPGFFSAGGRSVLWRANLDGPGCCDDFRDPHAIFGLKPADVGGR